MQSNLTPGHLLNLLYSLNISSGVAFACCDSIAQFILVRTTRDAYHSIIFFTYILKRYTVVGLCGVVITTS